MTRRTIGLLVPLILAILVAPVAAEAQPRGDVHRIGLLNYGSPPSRSGRFGGVFRQGLRDLCWVEGQHLVIEERFAEGREARVSDIAHEFVTGQVEVVVVPNTRTAQRIQQVTRTVPIVVWSGGDLVTAGLVASLAKPGGNVTGLQIFQPDLAGKRLEFLRGAVPQVSRIGFFFLGPRDSPVPAATLREAETAARALGVELHVLELQEAPDEFPRTFAALTHAQVRAVMVHANPFMYIHRAKIAALALEHRLPTIFEERGYVEAGGLMSYGPNLLDLYRRAATYVDKILKGAKPADLPVEQPSKFELVINLKTAQALGLTIPPTLLFQADEVLR
jgi:putative tryptophan/tyrosine transport system substrate-binding protein